MLRPLAVMVPPCSSSHATASLSHQDGPTYCGEAAYVDLLRAGNIAGFKEGF